MIVGTGVVLVSAVVVGVVAMVASVRTPDRGTSVADSRATGAKAASLGSVNPPTDDELHRAVVTYRASVSAGLAQLRVDAGRLRVAVRNGDRGSSQRLWLTAHLDYERLGVAYGTFGDLDAKINGRPAGLAGGVNDPNFTGFLRLERGLWGTAPMATLAPVADQLDNDVGTLVATFPGLATPIGDLPLRAHEILENTLQLELSGRSDQGSGTELATVSANIDGTNLVLDALSTVLADHDPALLSEVQDGLRRLTALVDAQHHPDGTWTSLSALAQVDRERIDGATGDVLENLADVALTLESQADRD
jgi:high-affinity iron transporter